MLLQESEGIKDHFGFTSLAHQRILKEKEERRGKIKHYWLLITILFACLHSAQIRVSGVIYINEKS